MESERYINERTGTINRFGIELPSPFFHVLYAASKGDPTKYAELRERTPADIVFGYVETYRVMMPKQVPDSNSYDQEDGE